MATTTTTKPVTRLFIFSACKYILFFFVSLLCFCYMRHFLYVCVCVCMCRGIMGFRFNCYYYRYLFRIGQDVRIIYMVLGKHKLDKRYKHCILCCCRRRHHRRQSDSKIWLIHRVVHMNRTCVVVVVVCVIKLHNLPIIWQCNRLMMAHDNS